MSVIAESSNPGSQPGRFGRGRATTLCLAVFLSAVFITAAVGGGARVCGAESFALTADSAPESASSKAADRARGEGLPIAGGTVLYVAASVHEGYEPILLAAAASDDAAPDDGSKAAQTPKPATPIRLFGTVEFRSPIKNLPKWERVRTSESKRPSFIAAGIDTKSKQVSERWSKLKANLEGASLKEKVQKINNFFNQWPYKMDREVWGVEDYWATPREFVEKSGDCEDYAIAKYYALRELGVPAEQLRIAAIKDVIRNLGHAVTIVYMENDAYVLDNLTNLVLSHTKLKHYAPQYSVNEQFLWRHVKPKAGPTKK